MASTPTGPPQRPEVARRRRAELEASTCPRGFKVGEHEGAPSEKRYILPRLNGHSPDPAGEARVSM